MSHDCQKLISLYVAIASLLSLFLYFQVSTLKCSVASSFQWRSVDCSCDDCVEHEREDYLNCSVLYCMPLTFTFTYTFGEDSMLSSTEAVIRFGPVHSPEITVRLYKSL